MNSILFVCTANMVRSPIAEALLKNKLLAGHDEMQWRIGSAGTWADPGRKVTLYARDVMLNVFGIDLSLHRSQLVNLTLLKSYKLILVMETGHKEAIKAEFPEVADRVYLLYEMVDRSRDVEDPIGGTLIDYQEAAIEIDSILSQGFEKISQLSQE